MLPVKIFKMFSTRSKILISWSSEPGKWHFTLLESILKEWYIYKRGNYTYITAPPVMFGKTPMRHYEDAGKTKTALCRMQRKPDCLLLLWEPHPNHNISELKWHKFQIHEWENLLKFWGIDDVFWLFGPKSEKMTESWIKLCNEKFNNFQSYVITMFRSGRLGLSGHVARMGTVGCSYKIVVVNITLLWRLCVGGWIIREHRTYRNRMRKCGLDSSG
jgi:hypothetical protein